MQDIHTHLYWESYDSDRDEVIARAREAGIHEMLVVGTTLEESRKAIALVSQHENIFASVGIHPNEFRGEVGEYLLELEEIAQDKKVVAIGECGLDYSVSHGGIDEDTKASQKKGFEEQLALADKLALPVIIHCRDAYEDLLVILKERVVRVPIVMHCYMGNTDVTKEFLKLPNLFFSFTGNITYPVKKNLIGTGGDITETVRLIPKERVFIETDCPFLAPQVMRGKRNEPVYALYTAEKVCELLGITRLDLDVQLEENFRTVFKRS
ncbi:MAG: TatD family hydrolase [Candidatus Moranbacteria bacterium]|nr:TatD family hydrolase [Candidatus Moranbacteria bacterium]